MVEAPLSVHGTLRGRYAEDEPLARHSTWRCGGAAQRYFEPADRDDLAHFLAGLATDEPVTWLGLGSNLLVRDGGVRGTVIATTPGLTRHHWQDGEHLYAECGVACAHLARAGAQRDRAGLEFLAGIPGTVGGALCMNAGALGSETWDHVAEVETIDRAGVIRRRARAEFTPRYRGVQQPEPAWFLAACFHLPASAHGDGQQRIREVLARRTATQPTGQASCGSVFKNPPGDYAGRLIEQCGLKGFRIGGCAVSTVHANFIVNDRACRAADIEALIAHVRAEVERVHGVCLESEVVCIGEASDVTGSTVP